MLLTPTVATFLPLIFYIFSQHLFWNISYTADKISVRSKSMFFPEMFSQIIRISFPNMICCIILHQIYYFTDRHCWFCFYHVMNMIFLNSALTPSKNFTLGALGVLDTFCSFDILCKLLSKATRRRQRSLRTHHGNYFVSLCVVCFLQNLQYFLVSILSGCAFLSLVVL